MTRLVGRNLKLARRLAGMSQEQVAKLAGVTTGQLSEWERGQYEPRPAARERLAEALEVPVWWLYRDHSLDDEPEPEPEARAA